MPETLDPNLKAFLQKTRKILKQRIDFSHSHLKLRAEPAKILWAWAVALGAMTYDMSGSALLLLQRGHTRAAVVLNRCVFEYWVRLRFYEKDRAEADKDLNLIKNRFRNILKSDPTTLKNKAFSAPNAVRKDGC